MGAVAGAVNIGIKPFGHLFLFGWSGKHLGSEDIHLLSRLLLEVSWLFWNPEQPFPLPLFCLLLRGNFCLWVMWGDYLFNRCFAEQGASGSPQSSSLNHDLTVRGAVQRVKRCKPYGEWAVISSPVYPAHFLGSVKAEFHCGLCSSSVRKECKSILPGWGSAGCHLKACFCALQGSSCNCRELL